MKRAAFFGLLATAALFAVGLMKGAPTPGKIEPAGPPVGFGDGPGRNLVNTKAKGITFDFSLKKNAEKKVKWKARLGSKAYGGPIISGGRVFIGTNNDEPRDPKVKGDKGVLMCFDEKTGKFLWQIVHDKLPGGQIHDSPREGVLSVPTVEGDRVYYVSNRCELVSADVTNGRVRWSLDMPKELGVYPCQASNSAPLIMGDLVYAGTANGVNFMNGKLPAPKAPSLVAVNKKTGKAVWKFVVPGRIMRGQWSSPTGATVNGKKQVIHAGGDGWLYGLDAGNGDLLWKFDCNPKKATPYKPGGSGERCFIIGVPVVVGNLCYVAVGQEPDDSNGPGNLWCVDISKKPANKEKDLSPVNDNFDSKAAVNKNSGLVWHYGWKLPKARPDGREYNFGRTLTTVCVHGGLVYASELAGFLHCLDAKTGEPVWEYDMQDGTWCSPTYIDGKVLVGSDASELLIFQPGRKKNEPKKINVNQPLKVPPVAANGVLYVNNGIYLYAIK